MIARMGDVISDGITGKRVSHGFTGWHSLMTMDEIPGELCAPFPLRKWATVSPPPAPGPRSATLARLGRKWATVSGMTKDTSRPNRRWCPTKRDLG